MLGQKNRNFDLTISTVFELKTCFISQNLRFIVQYLSTFLCLRSKTKLALIITITVTITHDIISKSDIDFNTIVDLGLARNIHS